MVVKKLMLMTLRDIKSNKGQYIAIIMVVVVGIAMYKPFDVLPNLDNPSGTIMKNTGLIYLQSQQVLRA